MDEIANKQQIAILIDADNSPAKRFDFVLSELAKFGVANVRRAYGNWTSPNLKGWEAILQEYAIQPIQQYDYTKGKNASDMAMTIDAMDFLHRGGLDAVCIVSSDSDFTPLVMRIKSEGLTVYGFGKANTPEAFQNVCTRFLVLDEEAKKGAAPVGKKCSGKELKGDTKLMNLLRNAVDSARGDDGWSALSAVGSYIANQASFDPRNYGYQRLLDLLTEIDKFEIKKRGQNFYVVRQAQ